jgi:DMSO/TMAO reductase YedYZ molybdopterin-dependent catalytic subunit
MTIEKVEGLFPTVGDNERTASTDMFYREEVQLASRNRGMPLEALRYNITPAGMHYLLIHFDIPFIDADTWNLEIGGLVANPISLNLDVIKSRPAVTMPVTMECAGNGRTLLEPRAISQPWGLEAIGTAEWTGTPLAPILDDAGLDASAIEILFTGQDRGVQGDEIQDYQRSLTLDDATREEVMLVYEMNGQPLQPQHGFPVRLMVPGWYGMTSVKWLTKIEAISEHFSGYQQDHTYRYKQDADDFGEPVDIIRVRALMVPPGIPDFLTRTRLLDSGTVTLEGRAWAGRLGINRVEVSADNGETWRDARMDEPVGKYAWRGWACDWDATPGNRILSVRATDSDGNVQPTDQPWNYQGMGNNMVHRVNVVVR